LGDDEVVPELKALFAESIAASPAGWTAMQVPLPLGLLFSVECVVTIGE
jgi:hypothetical protein